MKDRIFVGSFALSIALIYISIFSAVLAVAGKIGWTFPMIVFVAAIVLNTIAMAVACWEGDRRSRGRGAPHWRLWR